MGLGFALCGAIAYWRASSEFGVDVSAGLAWLGMLLAAFGWGLYAHARVGRDLEFEQMWTIAHGVVTICERQGVATDSLLSGVRALTEPAAAVVVLSGEN